MLTVYNIVATAPDTLWLGTNAGLWFCLPDQGVLRRPRVQGRDANLVRESVIRSLLQDARGHLWLGTHAQVWSISIPRPARSGTSSTIPPMLRPSA